MPIISLETQIEKILRKELEEITLKIQRDHADKIRSIKREIYGNFINIIQDSFQIKFYEFYGNNFDKQSLNNSLIFITGSGILPDFQYDTDQFKFTYGINQKARKFNLNTSSISNISEIRSIEANPRIFNVLDEVMNEENLGDEEEDEILDDILINFTSTNRKRGIQDAQIKVEEAFKQAKDYALDEFNREYVTQIKPRILKKYGIKLQ